MSKIDKIQELKQKIETVSQKHLQTQDAKEEKIYQYLLKQYSIISLEIIRSFTREKDIVKNLVVRFEKILPILVVFSNEDSIFKVGSPDEFLGNAFFSAKHDRSFFYTPNSLEKLYINTSCIHPAKLEEAGLFLIELKKAAEYSTFEPKSFFESR